jgi:exopolyphosphatase/guanosine-5'-triphosphate,3'-diphosphate pyrophosphatase
VRSLDVGCRRITERYLSNDDPPREGDLVRAHLFCADAFERGITLARKTLPGDFSPERLVVCGGTSTSLVAIKLGLVPYDSSKVHLSELAEDDVTGIEEMLASITEAQRAQVPGIQPKRAPVILGGVIAIRELMRKCLFDRMTVSESDLLVGLSIACAAAVDGLPSPIGWAPSLSLV